MHLYFIVGDFTAAGKKMISFPFYFKKIPKK